MVVRGTLWKRIGRKNLNDKSNDASVRKQDYAQLLDTMIAVKVIRIQAELIRRLENSEKRSAEQSSAAGSKRRRQE